MPGQRKDLRDVYKPFLGTNVTNDPNPYVEIEYHFDERKVRGRARQGWEVVNTLWQQGTNAKADNGYPVIVIGRTVKARIAAEDARKKAKAAKSSKKKTTSKKTSKKRR